MKHAKLGRHSVARTLSTAVLGITSLFSLPLLAPAEANAAPTFIGPTPYLAFDNTLPGAGTAISPFAGTSFSYFYLETFEDSLLNTPGVVSAGGNVTGPGGITDSVDADDGTIDGLGVNGHSYFGSGVSGISFTFMAGVLGTLPTSVGIVWTDGATVNTVTFEAFDANGVSLGTIVGANIGDGDFLSKTAEDRFFGVINAGGISSISIKSPGIPGTAGSGIEVDHLQYGALAPIPEPQTYAQLLLGLGLLGFTLHRRNRKQTAALLPARL